MLVISNDWYYQRNASAPLVSILQRIAFQPHLIVLGRTWAVPNAEKQAVYEEAFPGVPQLPSWERDLPVIYGHQAASCDLGLAEHLCGFANVCAFAIGRFDFHAPMFATQAKIDP